jgi:hypothetical protein
VLSNAKSKRSVDKRSISANITRAAAIAACWGANGDRPAAPRLRTLSLSVKPASAKPDLPVVKAALNGYRALFFKAQDLFDEMYASLADRSTRRLLKSLSKIDLLLIDELGYINAKTEQTNIIFKLMEERHHRRPTIITTNLAYPEWQAFLGNRPLTDALLSRLRERCHTVKIDGPCLRAQQG